MGREIWKSRRAVDESAGSTFRLRVVRVVDQVIHQVPRTSEWAAGGQRTADSGHGAEGVQLDDCLASHLEAPAGPRGSGELSDYATKPNQAILA